MKILMSVVLVIVSVTAKAEPGPVGQWLMNQEVSLFSFGLYRLEQYLMIYRISAGIDSSSVNYDWDRNRIEISVTDFGRENITKEECKTVINDLRNRALIDPNTGTYFSKEWVHSTYADYFEPVGYTVKGKPDNMGEKLDKIFVLKVKLHEVKLGMPDPDAPTISCEGPLVSKKVMFSE